MAFIGAIYPKIRLHTRKLKQLMLACIYRHVYIVLYNSNYRTTRCRLCYLWLRVHGSDCTPSLTVSCCQKTQHSSWVSRPTRPSSTTLLFDNVDHIYWLAHRSLQRQQSIGLWNHSCTKPCQTTSKVCAMIRCSHSGKGSIATHYWKQDTHK